MKYTKSPQPQEWTMNKDYIDGWAYSDLSNVDLNTRRFKDINFSGCNFDGALIGDCEFRNCTFDHACFNGTRISSSLFFGCTFKDTTFRGAEIIYSAVMESEVVGCDFSGAYVAKSNLDINWDNQHTDGIKINDK